MDLLIVYYPDALQLRGGALNLLFFLGSGLSSSANKMARRRSLMSVAALFLPVVLSLQAGPHHRTVARTATRSSPPCMKRKAFKGGRLDEFLQAGEAEAKYGPGRYAAVSEREWKMEVSREESEVRRQESLVAYELQKGQLLQDHAILSVCGLAAVWSYVTPTAFLSYGVGALLGLLYIVLLQRTSDSFGAQTVEEMKGGPPPIIVPVIMVLMVAKYQTTAPWGGNEGLMLVPMLGGFITNYLAALVQAVYPSFDEMAAATKAEQ